jgi:hypothetical protein
MAGSAGAEDVEGEPIPCWNIDDYWKYRWEDPDLETYTLFNVQYDTDGDQSTWELLTEMQLTPTDRAVQRYHKVIDINEGATEYQMSYQYDSWENGTWATVVVESSDPGYPVGTQVDTGSYDREVDGTGTVYRNMNNLNFLRGTGTTHDVTSGVGAFSWSLTLDTTYTEVSNGYTGEWKPTWDVDPMKVGDTWKQDNEYYYDGTTNYQFGGDFTGSGTQTSAESYFYDFDWEVVALSEKTIDTYTGYNTFPEAYKIVRTGSFDYEWSWEEGAEGDSGSGTRTTGEYEKWYACTGTDFDAAWGIEYNHSSRLIGASYVCFNNRAPVVLSPPEDPITIMEDELWELRNEIDYIVEDPDSGQELTYTVTAELDGYPPSPTTVLPDLTIDSNGDIEYTPVQVDVADGYLITINVTDDYEDQKGVDITFTLNIKNKNDPPTANPAIMQDLTMDEGEEKAAVFKLSDVFSDPDMGTSPLTGQVYNPDETLTYSVSNNGSIRVMCGDKDLGPLDQCDTPTFKAVDGQFPRDIPVQLTFTATDASGAKANDQVTVTVKHVNHVPGSFEDPDTMYIKEDSTNHRLDLKKYFYDIDVGNPNYPTSDSLTYSFKEDTNFDIKVTSSKVIFEPIPDYYGEDTLTFRANDKSGAKAEIDIDVVVESVNDWPVITSSDPDLNIEMDETEDGTEDSDLASVLLSVTATDIENDQLTYYWVIEDPDNGYDPLFAATHGSEFDFETAFDGNFMDGKFHGGDDSTTYMVTCIVTDGHPAVDGGYTIPDMGRLASDIKTWIIEVNNVNRNPVIDGIDVIKMKNEIPTITVPPESEALYHLGYAKIYRLDASKYVTDLDEGIENGAGLENIDNLTFEWSSHLQGAIGTGAYIDVGIGKESPMGLKLKDGKKHIMTLRVTDDDSGFAEYVFTLKVEAQPKETIIPGFEVVPVVLAIVASMALLLRRKR